MYLYSLTVNIIVYTNNADVDSDFMQFKIYWFFGYEIWIHCWSEYEIKIIKY